MKFSHFEKEDGDRIQKAFLGLNQLLGDSMDDYFLEAEITEEGELTIKLDSEEQEIFNTFLKQVDLKKEIEDKFEILNFESEPFAFDDIYLIPKSGEVSRTGAIIYGDANMTSIAKTSEILDGVYGLQINYPMFGEVPIELPIELSQELIHNVRDLTVNPGKSGSPKISLNITHEIEFNIDGDNFQTFANGAVLYNETLNCMWRWEGGLFKKIIDSDPVKIRVTEIGQKNQDLLDNLGI